MRGPSHLGRQLPKSQIAIFRGKLRAAHADLRVLFGGAHALMREAGALLAEAEQLDRARSAAEDERSSMNK